ncbi:universal stress protein [Lysobacter sp. S4-A87]|uniref:universal stress protein n=1 Tax=Lysobacter sp. S4-A87 TaxID=2925843 RepID=UPI001F535E9E|nr:universal stress protein [Lysobacter sp. S4-A87]UNK49819.1 universal stress protein [Lysobacter sp. S4-A87]
MRDVLIHLATHHEWDYSALFAGRLSARLKASLTGALCCPPVAAAMAGDVGGMVAMAAVRPPPDLDALEGKRRRFGSWASSMGVSHSDLLICQTDANYALQSLARWHDLLVLPAGDSVPWGSEPALAEILVTSQAPCLVVPEGCQSSAEGECIAVAWDGSQAAAGALHAALPLLDRAKRIVALVGKNMQPPAAARMPHVDLERQLARHGLSCVREPVELGHHETDGAALLHAALGVNADLIVLGAFGRTRLSEWVLGGVSRYMLEHSPLPILMRH